MNHARTLALLVSLAVVGGLGLATVPAQAADATPATTSLRQRATVSWDKGRWVGRDRVAFAVPGIGAGELVCRPNATYLRITPADRTRETSLWSVLAQRKGEAVSYAVRNARVYRFGTPTAPAAGPGTGPSAQEGLNLENTLEDAGQGSATQLLSQRTALTAPAAPTAPVTSVRLSWEWSGFRGPRRQQRCHAPARLITRQPAGTTIATRSAGGLFQRPGPATNDLTLDWHGEADAARGKTAAAPVQLPYLGRMRATCDTGRDAPATLTFDADDPARGLRLAVTQWEGEGPEITQSYDLLTDPVTGAASVALPTNGMLSLVVTGADGRVARVTVSSWRKTNDDAPAENFCEIAAQATTTPPGSSSAGDR